MSITAYKVEAVGHDRTGEDYGYVNIMYRYGNKQSCPRPDQCEKMEVMWADESVYGPPAPGSKVGDFIQTWLMGSWDCGVFTHREIAQRLMDTFTGLKIKELAWFENPREKTLKNGKPRARRAKWLPDREVDLVYLYSDRYLDARNPSPAETDFFTVTRMDAWGMSTWFMCTPEAAGKLIAMDYDIKPALMTVLSYSALERLLSRVSLISCWSLCMTSWDAISTKPHSSQSGLPRRASMFGASMRERS